MTDSCEQKNEALVS